MEQIFLNIAQTFGIKTLFVEGNTQASKDFKEMLSSFAQQDYASEFSKQVEINSHPLSLHLWNQTVIKDYQVIPAEDLLSEPSFSKREMVMAKTILQEQKSALLIVGNMHLGGIYENTQLQQKFLINLVNTVDPLFADILTEGAPEQYRYYKNPIVKNFIFTGMLETNLFEFPKMVKKANKYMINLLKQEAAAQKPDQKEQEPIFEKLSNIKQSATPLSIGISKRPLPELLPSQDKIIEGKFSSAQSTRYPMESVPIAQLIQAGFWLAYKAGLCAKPEYNIATVVWHDKFSEDLANKRVQEAAAERKLHQAGSSLESALDYFFGKKYTQGTQQEQLQQKQFLIDIINGNVDSEISNKFNEVTIIQNKFERHKQMAKLVGKKNQSFPDFSGPSNELCK